MPDELAVQDGSKHIYLDFRNLNSSRIVSISTFLGGPFSVYMMT